MQVVAVEVQRKNKNATEWNAVTSPDDFSPSWFLLSTARPLPNSDLNDIPLPQPSMQWASNWKILMTNSNSDTNDVNNELNEEIDFEGWSEGKHFSIKCENGVVLKYPPIKDRPVRVRRWYRKFTSKAAGIEESNQNVNIVNSDLIANAETNICSKNPFAHDVENEKDVRDKSLSVIELEKVLGIKIKNISYYLENFSRELFDDSQRSNISKGNTQSIVAIEIELNEAQMILSKLHGRIVGKVEKEIQSELNNMKEQLKELERLQFEMRSQNQKADPQEESSLPALAEEHNDLKDHLVQSRLQIEFEEDLDLNEDLISANDEVLKQREMALKDLNRDIKDVHEAMSQLSTLVKSQGENLSHISMHTEKAKTKTQNALQEIKKAENLQSKNDCVLM